MSSPCKACGHVHCSEDAVAIGRFRSDGVTGYTSTVHPEHPLRGSREEAEKDTCDWRSAIAAQEPRQGEGGDKP